MAWCYGGKWKYLMVIFFGTIMQNFYSNYLKETNVMDFIWNNLA